MITYEERIAIVNAVWEADSGCSHCASQVMKAIAAGLPSDDWREAWDDVGLDPNFDYDFDFEED